MNNQIKYSLAGFCMGVAELIPGISGATVAVIFKIYPNLMKILSNLRVKNLTLNLRSLSQTFQFNISLPLIFSMMIAVILCSKGINYLLTNYEELFLSSLGLLMIVLSVYIVNFLKDLIEDKKLVIFLSLGIIIGFALQELNIGSGNTSIPYLFLSGILAFSFFLIPGISGSAMLVVLGVYGPIIQAVAIFDFALLAPFALGCLISLFLLPKAILSIYSSHELTLMHIFSGLILSSGVFLL
jgi:putative membrane protein|tara:strand:- start:2881 stop:3603 length:723 start_codon:yes stop_codon:yes gene_type:complete